MKRIGLTLAVLVLVAVVASLAVVAVGQIQQLRQQYAQRLRDTDMNNAEEVYQLAVWCYDSKLRDEALKHALRVHELAPDDVRAKYLVYVLKAAPGDGEAAPKKTTSAAKVPELSEDEIKAIWNDEGAEQMAAFRTIQKHLVRRCVTPECHSTGNPQAKFVLSTTQIKSEKTITENFKAIEKYLNRENPDQSALVRTPFEGPPAGHPSKVIRSQQEPVYRGTVKWVDSLLTETEKMFRGEGAGEVEFE